MIIIVLGLYWGPVILEKYHQDGGHNTGDTNVRVYMLFATVAARYGDVWIR